VGNGQASPITTVDGADARIFVHSRLDGRETLQALSLDTGETLWKQAFEEPYEPYPGAEEFGKGPKATPAAAGGRVCALSVSGYVTCFRSSDGKLLWRKGFRDRFSKSYPPFGASSSPLFVDSALVVHVGGHHEGALLALDPETGKELWSYEGEGPGYSSPIVAELHGQRQIVTQAHKNLVAVAATTGELSGRAATD
jgi:outer membrane protein assembly factor BamB